MTLSGSARIAVSWTFVVVLGSAVGAQSPEPTSKATRADEPIVVNELIKTLCESDWKRVSRAAFALEATQAPALPALIKLLERDEQVQLEDTADLIYPGAKEFYGHGGILDYDIDWLSVRAGWVLEQLTFQDFGFSEGAIHHDELLRAVIAGKKAGVTLRTAAEGEQRKKLRAKAVAKAQDWWKKNPDWQRLSALNAALASGNQHQVHSALHWLRSSEAPIAGFSAEVYARDVLPLVTKLAKSTDEGVATQAGYLANASEQTTQYWLQQKLEIAKFLRDNPGALARLVRPGEIHEFLRNQAGWQLCRQLEGYELLRESFEIESAYVGNINLFPKSLHVDLKTTRRGLINAIWWWNPVDAAGKPQRNWNELLNIHEAATKVLSKHAWLAEWREAAADRSVELHVYDNRIGATSGDLEREILPRWQHARLAGKPEYCVIARRGRDGWAVMYFGSEERAAMIKSTTNPDWRPTHWLDTLEMDWSSFVVVHPDGQRQQQDMPRKP